MGKCNIGIILCWILHEEWMKIIWTWFFFSFLLNGITLKCYSEHNCPSYLSSSCCLWIPEWQLTFSYLLSRSRSFDVIRLEKQPKCQSLNISPVSLNDILLFYIYCDGTICGHITACTAKGRYHWTVALGFLFLFLFLPSFCSSIP